jgi:hypothetical protein
MAGGQSEVHKDTEPLITDTHEGANGAAAFYARGGGFRSNGANPSLSLYVENETQGTAGALTAATEETVTASGVTWDKGDTMNIYKTATKGSTISTNWVDTSRGWKSRKSELHDGWREEDIDIDKDNPGRVWGPGQPERAR